MQEKRVDPSIYDDYYFRDVPGYNLTDHYVFRRALKLIEEIFGKKKGRVLDVGFGRGEMLIQLFDNGWECCGVDYSEAAIKKATAKAAGRNIHFLKSSASDLDFPKGYFDLVLFLNVWEHLSTEEIKAFFERLKIILKPEGFFIAQTSPTFWQVKFGHFVMKLFGLKPSSPAWHINEQTIFSVKKVLKRAGFEGRIWLERTPRFWSSQIDEKFKFLKRLVAIFDHFIDNRIIGFVIDHSPLCLFFSTDIWIVGRAGGF